MGDQIPAAARPDPRDAHFDTSGLDKGMGRRVGTASLGVLGVSLLKMLVVFGGIAVIARLIPPAEFGIFALAMPAVGIALALSNFGLPQAIVQRKAITHAEASSLFWVNLGLAAGFALVVVALSGLAGRVFDEPRVVAVYQAISISVLLAAVVGQYGALMRRTLRSARFEVIVLVSDLAALALAIALALAGASYWALVAQQIAAQLFAMIGAMVVTGWRPSTPMQARLREVRDALSFGGYVAGSSILTKMMRYAGTVITGARLDPEAAGLYTRAIRLGNMPAMRFMTPLSGTFIPALSILQDQPAEMEKTFVRMISRANLALLPLGTVIAAGAEPVVALLLGPTWLMMAPVLAWFSARTLVAGANIGMRFALYANGQSRIYFLTTLVRFLVTAAALYVAAGYGLLAMTITYMVVDILFSLPVMIAVTARHTPLSLPALLRGCCSGMGLTVALIAVLILAVNPMIAGAPALVQLIVIVTLTGLAHGLRIARDPGMRGDVLRVLERATAKLPGRRKAA